MVKLHTVIFLLGIGLLSCTQWNGGNWQLGIIVPTSAHETRLRTPSHVHCVYVRENVRILTYLYSDVVDVNCCFRQRTTTTDGSLKPTRTKLGHSFMNGTRCFSHMYSTVYLARCINMKRNTERYKNLVNEWTSEWVCSSFSELRIHRSVLTAQQLMSRGTTPSTAFKLTIM